MKKCEVSRIGWDGDAHLAATNIELTVRPAQESMQEKRVSERSQGNGRMKAAGRGEAKGERTGEGTARSMRRIRETWS